MTATSRTALLAAALAVACSRPKELPDMGVSRTTLSFEAPGGSGEPAAQTLYVVNTGRGSLARPTVQIGYQQGAGWLAATVSGSGAPYAVAVQPSVSALAPGVYGATVTLSCGNASSSPLQVDVTLTVPDPRFTLSAAAMTFDAPRGGGDPTPNTFLVVNGGRGTLPVPEVGISYVGASGWLSAAVSGTPEAYAITLTPRVAGLDSGSYTATLAVSAAAAEGPPRTLTVTLNVPPAEIALDTAALWFDGPSDGRDPTPSAVVVANQGGGLLDRPVASVTYEDGYSGPPWLELTVSGTEAPYRIAVQPHQSHAIISIPSGTYRATVQVTAPDAARAQAFRVTLVVPIARILLTAPGGDSTAGDRTLAASFSNIAGCPLPSPRTIVATNEGAGALARPTATLSAPSMAGWLSVDIAGDDVPYQVTLTVTRKPAADEAHSGYLMFGAPYTYGATVFASYAEEAPWSSPTISVVPASVSIYMQDGVGDPVPQKLQVTTKGICSPTPNVSVVYTEGEPAWIQATAAASGPTRHEVAIAPSVAGMQVGTQREATVVVSLPERTWVTAGVPVTLSLAPLRPAASMTTPRYDHTLTVLPDGRVLAAGGYAGYGAQSATELWSPGWSGASWTAAAGMTRGRYGHGATVLENGDVLVCGGHLTDTSDDTCEALHGGVWESRPSLTHGCSHPALVPLADGKVLIAGSSGVVEIYDPSGSSTAVPGVTGTNAVKLADGRVLVVGSGRAWTYDPATGSFTPSGAPALYVDWRALALLPDGGVLAVGSGPAAERWDPVTGAWRPVAPPTESHHQPEVVALANGKVMALGATGGSIEIFDPVSETWSLAGVALPAQRPWSAAVRLPSGMVMIAGGESLTYPYGAVAEAFTW